MMRAEAKDRTARPLAASKLEISNPKSESSMRYQKLRKVRII